MKQRERSSPVIGGTSLLVIFGVLCLTVFSLLTLSTAQAGRRLSEKSAQSASAYYAAELEAEEIFARLRMGQLPRQVRREENLYSYSVPITHTQTLQIQLQKTETGWTVLRWQACVSQEPVTDQTLPLWDGTTPQEVTP